MKITINGKEHDVETPTISHERVCELAGKPVYASLVYVGPRHGDSERSGTTYAGNSIDLEDGMIINCVVTGSA